MGDSRGMKKTVAPVTGLLNRDPVLDWYREVAPEIEIRGTEEAESVGVSGRRVRVEIDHRRHSDHPTWEIPALPEDLFPLRAAAALGNTLKHEPICSIVRALRSGETARVRSDHAVGPLCHALEDRCAELVDWQIEQQGPVEWTILLTRR